MILVWTKKCVDMLHWLNNVYLKEKKTWIWVLLSTHTNHIYKMNIENLGINIIKKLYYELPIVYVKTFESRVDFFQSNDNVPKNHITLIN